MNKSEQTLMQGICPDCGKTMRQWSISEITEAKADIGMGPDDDFADCCDACSLKYLPNDGGAVRPASFLTKGKS